MINEVVSHFVSTETLPFPCSYYSSAGYVREVNEDACALPPPGAKFESLGALLALADGVGGVEGGALASQQAVANLQALFYANSGPLQPDERLRFCFDGVNALNRLEVGPLYAGARRLTTLVAAVVRDAEVWIANVGDSRAYLVQATERRLVRLTDDHNGRELVQDWEVDLPAGVISRAIGLSASCLVDGYHTTWQPGDRLILCSDGLAALPPAEIVNVALSMPASAAARTLVEKALALDGSDNATALVAGFMPRAVSEVETRPIQKRNPVPRQPAAGIFLRRPAEPETPPDSTPEPPTAPPHSNLLPVGLLLGWISALLVFLLWRWLAALGF